MRYSEQPNGVTAWQPSTWPEAPLRWNSVFSSDLRGIFETTIVGELENVITDAMQQNGGLAHRGHVVAIGLLCAVDAISAYGYGDKVGQRYEAFIRAHFTRGYAPFARNIYKAYRNSAVHSWHLFEVTILPGDESLREDGGIIAFGLLDFFDALKEALADFFKTLETSEELQETVLRRYARLRRTARR